MAERGIDFNSIIVSGEKSVLVLSKENPELLFVFAALVLTDYFNFSHPNLLPSANRIAADLIETRQTWRAADFINLCKFFRQRQDIEELKVYGQMTPEKFIANVAVYEEHRAQALEAHHAKNKGSLAEQNKSLNDVAQSVAKRLEEKNGKYEPKDEVMGKEFDKVQAERERIGKHVLFPAKAPDEEYFLKQAK